jgi:4-amino-4-deoxy-L-arabinose transferase-like glycosyltransferase
VSRLQEEHQQRWAPWIGVGVLAGIAMEIKILVAPLPLSCLVGVLVVGPRRRLAGLRPGVAALIALALGSPNLIWPPAHGFPMALVAANIASGGSTSSTSRAALLPTILLGVGPVVGIVFVVGLVALLRTKQRRTVDGWIATGFLIFVVFLLSPEERPTIRPATSRRSLRRAQGRSWTGHTHGCGIKYWRSAY